MSDHARIAAMFRALGDPTRLRIFEFLRDCCCGPVAVDDSGDVRLAEGPTVGEVCCRIVPGADKINSTISHHLKELRLAGLVTIEQRGKSRICGIDREAVGMLTKYLGYSSSDDNSSTSTKTSTSTRTSPSPSTSTSTS